MTDLVLTRVQSDPDVTIGELKIGTHHVCWTCEDAERAEKIAGRTAIPRGRYKIELTYSPRFEMSLPLLMGVTGFQGVRIHAGNTADDTEGCILPGLVRRDKGVGDSRLACIEVRKWLDAIWRNGDEAWIVIQGPEAMEEAA